VTQTNTSVDITLTVDVTTHGTTTYTWYKDSAYYSATSTNTVTYAANTSASTWYVVVSTPYGNATTTAVVVNSSYYAVSVIVNPIVDAITAAGTTVPSADVTAITNFVIAGTTAGWWSKLVACYGVYGGTANSGAAAAINWKSPGTYNVTWSGNPTFNSLGVKSSDYKGKGLLSGLTYGPGRILEYSDISLSAYIKSGTRGGSDGDVYWISAIGDINSSEWANAGAELGYSKSATGFALINVSTSNWGNYGHFAYSAGAVRSNSLYIGQRAANVQTLILNGSAVKTDTLSTHNDSSLIGNSFYLMTGGALRHYFMASNDQHGFFSLGHAMSSAEITSFNTAVHALMTAFGR